MLRKYKLECEKIVETQNNDGTIFVYMNPDEREKKTLVEGYKLDEHTLNSALDPDEQSRLEFEDDHTAIIFKFPRNYSGGVQLIFKCGTMGVFVFKEQVIVLVSEVIDLFDGKQFMKKNTMDGVVLELIYKSIHHFLKHLKVFYLIADELEQKINKSMENKYLLNLFTLEKSAVFYLNAINSNAVLIEKLKNNSQKLGFDQAQLEYIDDILIENNQCYKQAEIYSNIIASLMDARASIVSNNLNVLIKTLNVITIAIMVPTLVVSIFSMNVKLPLDQQNGTASFCFILALAFISVVVFLFILKRITKEH